MNVVGKVSFVWLCFFLLLFVECRAEVGDSVVLVGIVVRLKAALGFPKFVAIMLSENILNFFDRLLLTDVSVSQSLKDFRLQYLKFTGFSLFFGDHFCLFSNHIDFVIFLEHFLFDQLLLLPDSARLLHNLKLKLFLLGSFLVAFVLLVDFFLDKLFLKLNLHSLVNFFLVGCLNLYLYHGLCFPCVDDQISELIHFLLPFLE